MASNTTNNNQIREFLPVSEESNLETIDYALNKWLTQEMDIFCTTNRGWEKTPVKWTSAERSVLSKKKREFRDKDGALILPIITIERTDVTKDPTFKGTAWGNIPPVNDVKGGTITVMRKVNQEKTANFENAVAKKTRGQLTFKLSKNRTPRTVYQTVTIPMPVYVAVTYKISIWSEFQQQMNEMVQPFITKTGGINYFLISHEGHRFEAFIQENFTQNNNVASLDEEERKYETVIEIKVLGHLISLGSNETQPRRVFRENAVDLKIPRENQIFADSMDEAVPQTSGIPLIPGGFPAPTAPGGSSGGVINRDLQILDEAVSLTDQARSINFTGAGVTAVASGDDVTVTIPGGSASTIDIINVVSLMTVTREEPSGTIDGVNTVFTVANTIVAGSESVYINGILLDEAATNDYTIVGSTITFVDPPEPGDKILVSYLKTTI